MPKKKRKKTDTHRTTADLVREVSKALRRQHYKSAIDLTRHLLKRDNRPEWRQKLAMAYLGRLRELVDLGLFEEALTIAGALQSDCQISPPSDLYFKILLGAGEYEQAVQIFYGSSNDTESAVAESEALLATLLLTSTEAIGASLPANHALLVDRQQTLGAIQALAEGKDELCQESIKKISRHSPYKDFRLFIAGLLAHYHSEPEEALARLHRIPESSALSGISRALIGVLECRDTRDLSRLVLDSHGPEQQFVLEFLGSTGLQPAVLERIRQAQGRKDYRAIFFAIKKNLDWFEPERLHSFCLAMLARDFGAESHFESLFGSLSPFESARLQALYCENTGRLADAVEHWIDCFDRLDRAPFTSEAERNMAKALIFDRLARLKFTMQHQDDFEPWAPSSWDEDWEDGFYEDYSGGLTWVECLEESLLYDPTHKETYQLLIAYYESHSDKASAKRWQSRLLEQYPDDAEALFAAANRAFARKAYKTALGFLEHLLEVDPINRNAIAAKIHIHITKARKHIKERKFHLARKEFASAAATEDPKHREGSIHLKWGLMELLAGNHEKGEALLKEGKQLHGDHIGTLLLLAIEAGRIGLPRSILGPDLGRFETWLRQPATAENAVRLIYTLMPYLEINYPYKYDTEDQVVGYLKKAKKCKFDQPALYLICDFLVKRPFERSLFQHFARVAKRSYPHQPRFIYYYYLAKSRGRPLDLSSRELETLRKTAEQAEHTGDTKTARDIKEFLGRGMAYLNSLGSGFPFGGRGINLDDLPPELLDELVDILLNRSGNDVDDDELF